LVVSAMGHPCWKHTSCGAIAASPNISKDTLRPPGPGRELPRGESHHCGNSSPTPSESQKNSQLRTTLAQENHRQVTPTVRVVRLPRALGSHLSHPHTHPFPNLCAQKTGYHSPVLRFNVLSLVDFGLSRDLLSLSSSCCFLLEWEHLPCICHTLCVEGL
jgi:hypothetical protein